MNVFADTDRKITKLKYKALQSVKRKDYELALQLIDCTASIEYLYNQRYVDNELEELLVSIGKAIIRTRPIRKNMPESQNVLFYDGFGFDTRGLALIYLRALAENGYHVVYMTDERKLERLTEISQLISDYKGDMLGIPNRISNIERARFIYQKVQDYSIGKAFFYTTPSDASGVAAFSSFPNNIIRYQINLTDHAFWLGKNVFDYCIEFRNYGGSISHFYRGIDSKKLLLQPYYPIISKDMPFQGFPFQKKEDDFVIFSGGALYKTEGRNNGYYQIVRRILSEHKNVKFWYAGFGENKEMNRLLADYRGQAFYTAERKDLYQILCNCDVYLNTYPFPGGLMTQYAAKAGLVPLKVKTGPEADGLLLNQKELGIDFDTIDDLINEVEKMLKEPAYKKEKSDLLINAVLSEEEFNLNLNKILENGSSRYALELKRVDDKEFIHTYKERYGRFDVETIVGSLSYTGFMRTMPFYYSLSLFKKIAIGGGASLTICCITYNPDWEKYKKTLISVLEQKHILYEIIISDDGSKENYFENVEELFRTYGFTNYKLLSSKENKGTVINIYRGLCAAKGTYVRIVSPGDLLPKETHLSEWYEWCIKNKALYSFGDYINYNDEKEFHTLKLKNNPRNKWLYKMNLSKKAIQTDYILLGDYICGASLMGIREFLLQYYDEIVGKVKYAEDNIIRLMQFDGVHLSYYSDIVELYEYGTGISTSQNAKWSQRLNEDKLSTNNIILTRTAENIFQAKCKKYVFLESNSKYRPKSRFFKYFRFNWAVLLKIISSIIPAKTRVCEQENLFFYNLILNKEFNKNIIKEKNHV